MKYVFPKGLAGTLVVLLRYQASAQGAEIVLKCQADFSPMSPSVMAVQITKEDQDRLQSQINGTVSNQNVKSDEYRVRENLNMKTDPYSQEFRNFNPAETSLVHL